MTGFHLEKLLAPRTAFIGANSNTHLIEGWRQNGGHGCRIDSTGDLAFPKYEDGGLGLAGNTYVTSAGLTVFGVVQVFAWERAFQQRFAYLAANSARRLVNVGYGLGFAQRIFESKVKGDLHLIEMHSGLVEKARARSLSSATNFILVLGK